MTDELFSLSEATVEDDVLRRILEQTLIPSPNVIEFAPEGASAFVSRLDPACDNVAELFHVNTQLSRHTPEARLEPDQASSVVTWYFEHCGHHRAEDLSEQAACVRLPHDSLEPAERAVLGPFGAGGPLARLLFAVDLCAVADGYVHRQLPNEDAVWAEQKLSPAHVDRLNAALHPAAPAVDFDADLVLLVVGVPWRSMLLHGTRGYRRMLMDAGVVVNALGGVASARGLEPSPVYDFYDDEVDGVLGHDGVERSLLAMVAVRPPKDDQ